MRIARELHDDIGQRMAVLTMDLDTLGQALPLSADEASSRLRLVSDRTLAIARDIQALSHRLYPARLEYLGLVSASASFCREISRREGADVAFSHDAVPAGLPPDVALALFRVLQEAVANALEHGSVTQVAVTLGGDSEEIRLEIADRGAGFDPDSQSVQSGLGLVGMRERMRMIGGELTIESRKGAGTIVRARARLFSADRAAPPAE